jgi:hypothetical protein
MTPDPKKEAAKASAKFKRQLREIVQAENKKVLDAVKTTNRRLDRMEKNGGKYVTIVEMNEGNRRTYMPDEQTGYFPQAK